MSYVRRGADSDVYVYVGRDGSDNVILVCSDCSLQECCETFSCATELEMIVHLGAHRLVGELVPQEALVELARDARRPESVKEG